MTEPKQKPISSNAAVLAAEPGEHTVAKAPGLILRVLITRSNALSRSWVVRVTDGGRRRRLGLGRYPDVGLAKARQLAQDARRSIEDPSKTAKRLQRLALAQRALTLSQAIDNWLAVSPAFKSIKTVRIRDRALRVHFAPLHARDVTSITTADIAAVLRTLAPQIAIKARMSIRAVFDYASVALEAHGVVIRNPADTKRLRALGWETRSRNAGNPHPAAHWRVMPEIVAELSRSTSADAACLLFIAATGVRAGTARLAKWSDIDLDRRIWTPPLADLKEKHHKRPFVIPLNDAAVDALARVSKSSRFAFGLLSEGLLTSCVNRLRRRHPDWVDQESGRPFSVHGFRSTFRTWVEEARRADSTLAELCLGHKVRGEVEARYVRAGLIEERRGLLDAWSRHLRGETAEVINIRATR